MPLLSAVNDRHKKSGLAFAWYACICGMHLLYTCSRRQLLCWPTCCRPDSPVCCRVLRSSESSSAPNKPSYLHRAVLRYGRQ